MGGYTAPVEEALYFKEEADSIFVKAQGHITAALCVDLRKKVYEKLKAGQNTAHLIFDLSQCDYMDSTFMGLLVGFNKKLHLLNGERLTVANPSEVCVELLTKLGVIKLLSVDPDYHDGFPEDMVLISQTQNPTANVLLQAHNDLSELSPENREKFSTLTKILRAQMKNEGPEDPHS
jgi:anti-anti-sigma factor